METPIVSRLRNTGRQIGPARRGDQDLGPFTDLAGHWQSLPGRGWNMIALPFTYGPVDYRLLMNQYDETLNFDIVDKAVVNRGIAFDGSAAAVDQFVVALSYEQQTTQIAAADSPASGLEGAAGLKIHHEPGLFLFMTNQTGDGPNLARLASVPHGDAALAPGRAARHDGPPRIAPVSGLPLGVAQNLNDDYLAPYKHFHDTPFMNLFDPLAPHALLQGALDGLDVLRTTRLDFDTGLASGGISNIPFIQRQANTTEMRAHFWIEELAQTDTAGLPILQLQYLQVVMLEFFPRLDGETGLIRWPHISINTLRRRDQM